MSEVLPRALALTQVHSAFGCWVLWLRPSTWSIFTWGTFCAGWLHLQWIPCVMLYCVMVLYNLTAQSILAQQCSWALFCPGKWLPWMPVYSSCTLLYGQHTKHQEESSALCLLVVRLWPLFDSACTVVQSLSPEWTLMIHRTARSSFDKLSGTMEATITHRETLGEYYEEDQLVIWHNCSSENNMNEVSHQMTLLAGKRSAYGIEVVLSTRPTYCRWNHWLDEQVFT